MREWVKAREHVGRARRVRVSMPAVWELAPGSKGEATIHDLSRAGFRSKSESLLYIGQAMKMHLPEETVMCDLGWAHGDEGGNIFKQKVAPPNGE